MVAPFHAWRSFGEFKDQALEDFSRARPIVVRQFCRWRKTKSLIAGQHLLRNCDHHVRISLPGDVREIKFTQNQIKMLAELFKEARGMSPWMMAKQTVCAVAMCHLGQGVVFVVIHLFALSIAAKRTDQNIVGTRRRIASKNRKAEKPQSANDEHIINIRQAANEPSTAQLLTIICRRLVQCCCPSVNW